MEHGTRRYRLLETIRVYANQRLAESGLQPATQHRHAVHYIALAEHASPRLKTFEQRVWIERLTIEQPNLRAALAYNINTGDTETAWQSIAALERFWDVVGQRREARDWIQRTLAMGDPPATPGTVAGLAAATMFLNFTDTTAASELARRAEQLAAGLDDFSRAKAAAAVGHSAAYAHPELARPALLHALALYGDDHPWDRAEAMQGLVRESKTLSEDLRWGRESVALFLRVGDQALAANTLYFMAQLCLSAGIADDEVYRWLTESQALAEAAGSDGETAHAAVGFATFARVRGDHQRSAEIMEQCLPTLRRLGDQRCTGRALLIIGDRARVNGDLASAEELLRASIEAVTLVESANFLGQSLEALAAVYLAQGRPTSAAVVLGAARSTPDEELMRALVQTLGTAAFVDAYAEGRTLTPTEVLSV
jgi:hypothetical protein